jgi:hypothetical protein
MFSYIIHKAAIACLFSGLLLVSGDPVPAGGPVTALIISQEHEWKQLNVESWLHP